MEIKLHTDNANMTFEVGRTIGRLIEKGSIVTLVGDLGTGKTVIAKGIADGLGVKNPVTSPTFNIVKEYKGREKLCHFDVYRINEPEEMFEIGFSEYISGENVCLIEWAELIEEILPREEEILKVELERTDDDKRDIIISGSERYEGLMKELSRYEK